MIAIVFVDIQSHVRIGLCPQFATNIIQQVTWCKRLRISTVGARVIHNTFILNECVYEVHK